MKTYLLLIFHLVAACCYAGGSNIGRANTADGLTIPKGKSIPVSSTFDITTGHYYTITGTLNIKPDLSSFVLPRCASSLIRAYKGTITIDAPYAAAGSNNYQTQKFDIDAYNCAASTVAEFNTTCTGKNQIGFSFTFKAATTEKDARILFTNSGSTITYTKCKATTTDTYILPVVIKDINITLQERE